MKNYIEKIIREYIDEHYIVCETSKTLVVKGKHVVGESEIIEEDEPKYKSGFMWPSFGWVKTKKIFTPNYSPAFAPKKK